MILECEDIKKLNDFGVSLGRSLCGGEFLELIGDIGAGKTTLMKAVAHGLDVTDDVQSPSFTISRVYRARDGLSLVHYDFYRLSDPGIMTNDLVESTEDNHNIVAVEWSGVVQTDLPNDRLKITIVPTSESSRRLDIEPTGKISAQLLEKAIGEMK